MRVLAGAGGGEFLQIVLSCEQGSIP